MDMLRAEQINKGGHGEENDVSLDELRGKVEEYATFIDKTLHPELQKAVKAREETESELSEYQELRDKLGILQKRATATSSNSDGDNDAPPLESLVDLGHQVAYCRAVVNDPTTVFCHVGMGFHAELTLHEAISYIDKRIVFLEKEVLSQKAEKAQTVASHLESSLLILEALVKELQQLENR